MTNRGDPMMREEFEALYGQAADRRRWRIWRNAVRIAAEECVKIAIKAANATECPDDAGCDRFYHGPTCPVANEGAAIAKEIRARFGLEASDENFRG